MANTPAVTSQGNKDLAVRLLILAALAGVVFVVLKRVLSGLASAVTSPFGYGLTPAEEAIVDSRLKEPMKTALYYRSDLDGLFIDAPVSERERIQDSMSTLRAIADDIANAPGFLNDNEDAVLSAIRRVPSLYDLLWVNRSFLGSPYRTLGVFSPNTPPQIGDYMDAFLQPRDWLRLMSHLQTLPKYLS